MLVRGSSADVGRALTAVSLLVSFDWISDQLLDLLVGRLRIDVRERFGTEMVEKSLIFDIDMWRSGELGSDHEDFH